MANLSIKSKLLVILLAVSLSSIAIVAGLNQYVTYRALEAGVLSHLTSLRTARASQIEQLLGRLVIEVRTSGQGIAAEAAWAFVDAFRQLDAVAFDSSKESQLREYYRTNVLAASGGTQNELNSIYPNTPAARYLQYHYIANNPYPEVDHAEMLRADDGSNYSDVHEKYHPRLKGLFLGLGFSNVLLIDIETGAVVYSARKHRTFATRLTDGPYAHGHLADLFRTLQHSPDPGRIEVADFQQHRARAGTPTAFVGTPLFHDGRATALLVVELPVDAIDRVMTDEHQWVRDGLGKSGEVYLVGPDFLMRSNARGLIEAPDGYAEALRQFEVPNDEIKGILAQNSTMLIQHVQSYAAEQAIAGRSGTGRTTSHDGTDVLASWAPLRVAGLRWGVVAEIDHDEAFAPLRNIARDTLIETLAIVLAITLVVMFLASSFVRPVNALIARVQLARSGKADVTFDTETGDEIGELSKSFRELIDGVQKQTQLLEHVTAKNQRLLETIMPKSIAERVHEQGNITEQVDDVTVVFAELKGLATYTEATSDRESVAALRRLFSAFDEAAARHGVEQVRTVGDTYLAVCGLSRPLLDHMRRAVEFALAARSIVSVFNSERAAHLGVTVGICSGTVVADVADEGRSAFQLWGAAVIAADHAMDCGAADDIVVTRSIHDGLNGQYSFAPLRAATEGVPLWTLVT